MSFVRAVGAAVGAACVGALVAVGPSGSGAPASAHGPSLGGSGKEYHLKNSHGGGTADVVYAYGGAADAVLVGDWDGDGTDTLAVRRGATYYLKNSHSGGSADRVYTYGSPGDAVLVGDWDGNGTDTLAVRRGATYHLKNSHSGGSADRVYTYGSPGDRSFSGDWDGDGTDTLAVRRGATYYLKNTHGGGSADLTYAYGSSADTSLAGDWDGNRTDTLGVRRGGSPPPPAAPAPSAGSTAFVTAVHSSGRYFVDGAGRPVLVRGDSPWSMFTDLSTSQVRAWAANRRAHGFNAAMVSLIGARDNGAPSDTGATYDGVLPFVGGDITRPNGAYWARVDAMLGILRDHGITAFLYPVDGWNIENPETFGGTNSAQLRAYGAFVARRYASYPNIVWVVGGDYNWEWNNGAQDGRFNAVLDGIRSTGDRRPASIQLGYNRSLSTDNPFWANRVGWNFVYTYHPTYEAVLAAYGGSRRLPALFAEGNYERENNQGDTPGTTDETLRRQVLWALTSGSPGDFYGSDDWEFHPGWADRLSTGAVRQIRGLRAWFAARTWHQLVPDTGTGFLTSGRGSRVGSGSTADVLESDYATAALAADRSWGVMYVPTARTIGVSSRALGGAGDAYWLDPCSLSRSARVAVDRAVAHPGRNACGAEDWLFVVEGR